MNRLSLKGKYKPFDNKNKSYYNGFRVFKFQEIKL